MLKAGNLFVDSCKNDIDPSFMMLFVNSDKWVRPISLDEWEKSGRFTEDWSSSFCEVEYRCSVSQMVDRLELKGYTLAVAEKLFNLGVQRRIDELKSLIYTSDHLTLQILQDLKLEDWINALRNVNGVISDKTHVRYEDVQDLPLALQYVWVNSWDRFGFPSNDLRCMLRLVLAACNEDDLVRYDLTELILGGCFESEADMVKYAEYLISHEYDASQTTIVLTEGSTDCLVLDRCMKLLYPHLAPFFSFMDFAGLRLMGGAGSLATMVKAFAGAKILNRVLAIFDNDTAGNSARESLKKICLPANIKVISLPSLELAKAYPTLGPNGLSIMDINGRACGLEMYLGLDALRGIDGNLIPVQWKGYDSLLRSYQGELLSKKEVLSKFLQNLTLCEVDQSQIGQFDWSGIRAIIDTILSSFHEEDSARYLELEVWMSGDVK